ncbi:MAG: transcriptional repressor NrdR [Gemmatimonadetes bacterium]|nr:transcriptional repressor NrdR [Gemmatimonadota bacterium]
MRCPACHSASSKVVDSRTARDGRAVRRRRECLRCSDRFTTYEYVEERQVQILKRTGSAEDFDRDKLRMSIAVACAKRPISSADIEALVDSIDDRILRSAGVEIPSAEIGEMVMEGLKPLDRVAYVRYASVYRNFQDIEEFQEIVDDLSVKERQQAAARFQEELLFPRPGAALPES